MAKKRGKTKSKSLKGRKKLGSVKPLMTIRRPGGPIELNPQPLPP